MCEFNKKLLFNFVMLMFSLALFTQTKGSGKLAELEFKLQKAKGIEKLDLLMQLSDDDLKMTPKQSLDYAESALQLARELKRGDRIEKTLRRIGIILHEMNKHRKALEFLKKAVEMEEGKEDHRAFLYMSRCHLKLDEYDLGFENINRALAIAERLQDKKNMAIYFNQIGLFYKMLSDYEKAVPFYLKSLAIYEELGDDSNIAVNLNNIGNIYSRLEQYGFALDYHLRSMKIKEKIGNKKGLAASYTNIGNIYFNLKDYTKALEYHQKSFLLKKKFSDLWGNAVSLSNIAACYIKLRNYSKALVCAQESMDIYQQIGNKNGISTVLSIFGEIYSSLHQFAKASQCYLDSLKIAEEIKAQNLIMENQKMLSDLYVRQGDYRKAFGYHVLFHETDKHILNENNSRQILEMQTRYDILKKIRENEKLKIENTMQKMRVSRAKTIRNATIAGFGLMLVFFSLLIKKYIYLFTFWKKQKYIGQYRLLECIGSGGMSLVYKAHGIRDKSQTVAVKVLKEEFSRDEDTVRRFMQEAAIVDKLDHPHIVKIIERGEDQRRLFLAMEYLEGETLMAAMAREGSLDLRMGIHIMAQLADAICLIHAGKIVHRDLKPSNIILQKKEDDPHFLKLLDFGLARRSVQTTMTKTGEILGTIGYMSPEQLLDEEITAASDIYSMGVIWYEMVCGKKIFVGENEIRVIRMVLDEMPVEPLQVRSELPHEMNRLIMAMIDKDPRQRPSLEHFQQTLPHISDRLN